MQKSCKLPAILNAISGGKWVVRKSQCTERGGECRRREKSEARSSSIHSERMSAAFCAAFRSGFLSFLAGTAAAMQSHKSQRTVCCGDGEARARGCDD